jgi:anti-sigma-K factor RskA
MTAEKSAADAGGVIVMSNDGNFGTLIVDGLPALDSARQYQLWLINEGKRTSGGVFSVMDNGYGVLIVNSSKPLSTYQNFGITIEPFGGSSGPTGDKVLGGKI